MTDVAIDHDGETLLHPEFRALLGQRPSITLTAEGLPQIREFVASLPPYEMKNAVEMSDVTIDGPDDNDVMVRVYRPANASGPLPCVVAIHGGGFVLGSYTMLDERFDAWCTELNCIGVSVEHRLSPEYAYPAPLEDCYAALAWVHQNAEELGVDPTRIGVDGTSAGGGFAASLTLLARDRGEYPIAFQILECPMIDDRMGTRSARLDRLMTWTSEQNEFGWRAYLGDLYGSDDVPYTAAPSRCTDLRGLPPTFLAVGGADGFRDEDVLYGLALMEAGNATELHVYPGAPHGTLVIADTAIRRQWERDMTEWLARQLESGG